MTDAVVGTVRIRGRDAARLARVAATVLPAALEGALADLGDCRIDEVRIAVDVDPFADDATIATLWAGAIRAELLLLGASRVAPATANGTSRNGAVAPSLPDAVAAARSWLASTPPRGGLPGAVLRTLAEALAAATASGANATAAEQPGTSGRVGAASTPELAALANELLAALAAPWSGHPASPPRPEDAAEHPASTSETRAQGDVTAAQNTASGRQVRQGERGAMPQIAHLAAELSALAELVPSHEALDPAALTAAAGLAIVYPWLADHARASMALHPGIDEATVRAHAFAALVDPTDVGLVHDPFVRLLAGVAEPLGEQVPLPHAREVHESAERVLASFASLVPGFERSSAAFVRGEWIARRGLVDDGRDPVLLTATSHPLDVVLGRLPYPLGLFRLPWSPPVMVRFRP
ncbi:contractile injection system tape measure protein [Demequina sp.]|uniref:contractile injection system tape measure protein n=1 Tax=Demequina sp. TaxID=2050685 RepID=UPI003D0D0474